MDQTTSTSKSQQVIAQLLASLNENLAQVGYAQRELHIQLSRFSSSMKVTAARRQIEQIAEKEQAHG